MAVIDSSMYLQQNAPDIAGGIAQGMKLRDLKRQGNIADNEQKFNETMKGAVIQDPATGALSFDKSKLSSLANIDAVKAMAMQQQQRQQAAEQQKLDFEQKDRAFKAVKEKTEFATNILGGVHDEGSYLSARKALIGAGFPEADIPEKHDPQWVKDHVGLGLDMKTRLDKEHREHEATWKERELGQSDAKIEQENKKIGIEGRKADAMVEGNKLRRVEQSNAKQGQYLNQTQQILESAKGNPEVSQALKDRYAANKLNKLIGGDPDKLNPQQVQLALGEMGKIATGGVPTIEELKHLRQDTIPSWLAEAAQKWTNSPSPANQGAFLKLYQNYANQLSEDANGVIENKYKRVLQTRKRVLHPDDYASLKAQYFDPLDGSSGSGGGGFKMPSTSDIDAELARRGGK